MDASAPIPRHLRHLYERNLRPRTIEQRGGALRRWAAFLAPRGMFTATSDDVSAFLARFEAPKSRANELSHVAMFYRWAILADLTDVDPTVKIPRPKLPRRLPRPIPSEDLRMALELADERVLPWLLLAAYAGLRACEIAPLCASELRTHDTPPLVIVLEGKGGGMRSVPLGTGLVDRLLGCQLPKTGHLFPRRDGKVGAVTAYHVSHYSNEFLHDIGIAHTLHTLRHWFLTNAYRISRDLRQVQELAGHRSSATTDLYTYVDPTEAVGTVDQLPSLS